MSDCQKNCARPGRPCDPTLEQRRKNEILHHAVLLFARHGYSRTDVGAIADAAGCAKGTVYNYFNSKLTLFQETVDYVMIGLLDATSSSRAEDPLDRISDSVRSFLGYFDEHPEFVEILVQERSVLRDRRTPAYRKYRSAHRDQARALFRSLIEAGVFREIPIDNTLDIIGNTLYGTIFTNYFTGRVSSMEQQAADIKNLIMHGLLTSSSSPNDDVAATLGD
ncbi:TetR/AcrR family transcriptional regulator [Oceanidesulfovibrio marinus]|uniref:TetR/AcrR family transcriptional regulator n=1 Tax=Oceanidesulfovibrio marinus TaxID=370038 RepID=A0ABX6NG60_9BACT|nr:TetR/AcrR family transcriptional regulator [Oceanidesulfovibrio marinus]QJT09568.1 TetR/AcrR family transcriptional regulator [Oceanidesulfovibrio marinus]